MCLFGHFITVSELRWIHIDIRVQVRVRVRFSLHWLATVAFDVANCQVVTYI